MRLILYICIKKIPAMASSNEEYILNKIDSPADLRLLPSGKLEQVCAELRQ